MKNSQQENTPKIYELMEILNKSHSAFHSTQALTAKLQNAGYENYTNRSPENLTSGSKGFIKQNDSSLIAFRIGKAPLNNGFKIVGSHTDSPTLRIKPQPIIKREGAVLLNTEVYGGPILNTWFDRPLSLAGRVIYRQNNKLISALISISKPILIIPNAAIHMNRSVNEGQKIEKQKMLLPFICLAENEHNYDNLLESICAEELNCSTGEIVDFDLYLYDPQPATLVGLNDELINSPRLDNVAMAYTSIDALINSDLANATCIAFASDNEEIGSRSRQGAASMFFRDFLEEIHLACGGNRMSFLENLNKSFLISADQAHAVHPNFPEFADPTNRPQINKGPVIKLAANLSYATDSISASVFKSLCAEVNVPYQTYVNHSDRPGGSTIGPISTSYLHCPTVDIGNAIWAMHSIRETGGNADINYLIKVLTRFFSSDVCLPE